MGGWFQMTLPSQNHRALSQIEDAQWIQQRFDAVFPPEAPLDRNAFPGVAKVPPMFWRGFSGGGIMLEFPMVGWNSALYIILFTWVLLYLRRSLKLWTLFQKELKLPSRLGLFLRGFHTWRQPFKWFAPRAMRLSCNKDFFGGLTECFRCYKKIGALAVCPANCQISLGCFFVMTFHDFLQLVLLRRVVRTLIECVRGWRPMDYRSSRWLRPQEVSDIFTTFIIHQFPSR